MIETIIKFGNWIAKVIKKPSGAVAIVFMVSIFPVALAFYIGYYELERKNNLLIEQKKEIQLQIERTQIWQEKAFSSEQSCLQKIREISKFFEEIKNNYKKELYTDENDFNLQLEYLESLDSLIEK